MLAKLTPPKTTSPLVKLIRTGEGILVYAANAALIVVPIATNALTAQQAIKYGVILNGTVLVARTILKIVAQIKPITGVPATLPPEVAVQLTAIAGTVAGLEKQIDALPKGPVVVVPTPPAATA